jgi:hypothetical protein
MRPADFDFVRRVIATSRSGPGFANDLEHRGDGPAASTAGCCRCKAIASNQRLLSWVVRRRVRA